MTFDIRELELSPTGTCFDDGLDFFWSLARKVTGNISRKELMAIVSRFRLAHGICQIPENKKSYAHAWVQEQDDTGENIRCWEARRLSGAVRVFVPAAYGSFYVEKRAREVTLYSFEESIQENLFSGHHGPWLERYRELAKPRFDASSADEFIELLGLCTEQA